MMPGLLTTGLLAGNAVVWGLKPGKYIARAFGFVDDAYDKYIKPTVDRLDGLRPDLMTVSRPKELNGEGKVGFRFGNVATVDFESIDRQISEETAKMKVDLAAMDADMPGVSKKIEEIKGEKAESKPAYVYYDVEIIIDKPDVRLGEIDFSEWQRSDFHIAITLRDTGKKIEASIDAESDYQKILWTLKKIAKVSAAENLTPNQIAENVIVLFQGGWGVEDWWSSFFATVKQKVAVDGVQHPHLQNENYVEGLIELALDRSTQGDLSILENYYGVVERSIKNELFIDKNTCLRLQKEVDARKSEQRKGKLILVAAITLGVMIVAGLVALTVFFAPVAVPSLIGIASAIVSTAVGSAFSVIKFFGSKILASFGGFALGALVVGVIKEVGESKKERLKIAEEKLTAVKENEKKLKATLEDVKGVKDEVSHTIKVIHDTEKNHLPQKILNLANRKLGSMDVALICRYLVRNDNHVQQIDLTGCEIDKEGFQALQQALANNFTVTELKYELKNKKEQLVDQAIIDALDKQLLMNRYLQGVVLLDADYGQVNELFGDIERFKVGAIKKIDGNLNITEFTLVKNPELAKKINVVMEQNRIFLQQPLSWDGCIAAFKLDSNRWVNYLKKKWSIEKEKDQIREIRGHIFLKNEKGEENLLKLKELEDPAQLLQTVFPGAVSENIELFVRIAKGLPEEAIGNERLKLRDFIALVSGSFSKSAAEFKEIFNNKRTAIERNNGIDDKLKAKMLEVFDLALLPKLGDYNSPAFKKYRLEELVKNRVVSQGTFAEFVDLYQSIPEEQLETVFAESFDRDKLIGVIKCDIDSRNYPSDSYLPLLKKLSEKHRAKLLLTCLEGKPNALGIATLVSKLLDMQTQVGAEYVWHVFDWGLTDRAWSSAWNFKDYIIAVEALRKQRAKLDSGATRQIEDAVQEALQAELVGRCACLRQPFGKDDFNELKFALENDVIFFNMRNFKLVGIDDEVKEYIGHTLNMNNLHYALLEHPIPEERFREFLKVYAKIAEEQERLECFNEFMKEGANKTRLLELIKNDINNNNYLGLRIFIKEPQRIELLRGCLGGVPHADGIATLVSKLMGTESAAVKAEYVWRIFDWRLENAWDFAIYIAEIKKLREQELKINPPLASQLDNIIQAALQSDLLARFECLKGVQEHPMVPPSFRALKDELEQNYDLTEFDFDKLKIGVEPVVKEYVKFICQRNLLKRYAEVSDLSNFMLLYSAMPVAKYKDAFLKLDKSIILRMLTKELGKDTVLDCKELRNLAKNNEEHCIALLTHVFALEKVEEQYASSKAKLISNLLKIDELFSASNNTKLVQEVKKLVYWGISTEGWLLKASGVPYYKFNELQKKLGEISAKIPESDITLKWLKIGLKKAIESVEELDDSKKKEAVPKLENNNELSESEDDKDVFFDAPSPSPSPKPED